MRLIDSIWSWTSCWASVCSRDALYVVTDDASTPDSDVPTIISSTVAITDSTRVKPPSPPTEESTARSLETTRHDPMGVTSAAGAADVITETGCPGRSRP